MYFRGQVERILEVNFRGLTFIGARYQLGFLCASFFVCFAVFLSESTSVYEQIDDAYISFRYAANFANGHGLVFNLGERVEGFTNLLWVLLIALGIKAGVSAELVAHLLGFVFGCTLMLVAMLYVKILLPKSHMWMSGLVPPLLLSSNSFSSWTASGLETPMFATLVMLALIAHAKNNVKWTVIFCILSTLTRPDGVITAAVLLGVPLIFRMAKCRTLRVSFKLWRPILIYSLFLMGLTLFRVVYYNSFLPNTFYAKVGGTSFEYAIRYVTTFLKDGPGFLLLLFPFALTSKSFRYGALLFFTIAAYILAVGGDVFMYGRYFLPILPIMIGATLLGVSRIFKYSWVGGVIALAVVPLCILWNLYGPWPTQYGEPKSANISTLYSIKRAHSRNSLAMFEDTAAAKHKIELLKSLDPPIETIALIGIGRIAFFSEYTVVDVLGLVDTHIARSAKVKPGVRLPGHQRTDSDYVFSRHPDAIFIPRKGDTAYFVLPAVQDLWDNPKLEEGYFYYEPFGPYLSNKYTSSVD